MAKALPLPDGTTVAIREGETAAQTWERAQRMYPEAFGLEKEAVKSKQDTSGFKAAASAGATRLGGEFELLKGKLGLKSEAEAQKEYEAAQKRAQERFTPTEKGFTEDPLLKFRELLGGSVPYMAAPAAAGLAALAAPVSVPVAAGLGLLGAGAVSTGQFTGSNLGAQLGTGKTLEEASLGKAVAAAVPQALIDTAAMALIPGVGKLFGSVGSKLTTEQAKAIANQTLGRTVLDYTAKTGVTAGREGVTEATQQVLERLQAGLNIADPEARKEYVDSFIGGAVLGGTLAPVGRAFERGGAKRQAAEFDRAENLKRTSELAQQQQAEEEAAAQALATEKQKPEYAIKFTQDYETILKEYQDKRKVLKDPGKNATPEEKAVYKEAQAEVSELYAKLGELTPEYRQLKEKARVAQMSPYDYMMEQTGEVSTAKTPKDKPDLGGYYEQQIAVPGQALEVYVAKQIDLANTQSLSNEKEPQDAERDYIKYLVANPALAKQALQNRTPVPGLTKKRQNSLYDALQLEITRIEAEDRAAGAAATSANQDRLSEVEAEEAAALEDQRQMRQAYEMQQEGRNATDIDRIKPISGTTAQGDLFGGEQQRVNMPVAGTRVDIDAQIAELKKELDVARSYGAPTAIERRSNRERVSTLLEQIRDLEERKLSMEQGGRGGAGIASEVLQAQLGDLPEQERAQREAARERDKAYDKFKTGEVDAKQDVIDGLLKEIALVRGKLKPETITEIEKELGALLDASARYGNDITPELDAVSTRWRAGTKFGAFGPAEAIPTTTTQDMLLDQMDRAYAQRQRYDAQTMSILDQIAENFGAVTANEDRRNLIGEWLNRATTGNLNPEMTRDVRSALRTLEEGKRSETETPTRQTAFGTATKPTQTAVQQELGAEFMPEQVGPQAATRIVNGKVQYVAPEDRGPIQGSAAERFAPTQKGTIFESFAELNRYLASDYLKAARQELGLTHDTVARLGLQIKEHEAKISNINKQVEALKARKATLEKSKLSEDRAAKNIIADAEVRMEEILRRLSDELEPLRLEYMQVRSQVDQLADRSEETSRLIANNIDNFKEMDDRAVDAAQETLKAKEELRQARNKLGSLAEKLPGIQAAQQKVIAALERQRNPLLYESMQKLQELRKQLSKARVTQPLTVARLEKEIAELDLLTDTQRVNPYIPSAAFITFLNNDLRLQLDAQEETRKLNKAGKQLLDLGLQLELAAADLDVNLSTHLEIVAIKQEIGTAKEMGADAVRALDNDLALLDSEIEKAENTRYAETRLAANVEQAIKDVSESRGFGAQMANVPIQPLSSAERDAVTARDKARNDAFQASTARLKAIPGQRIDFTKRREMLELVKTATTDFENLDATIKDLDDGVTEMQVRVELVQIKLDEATEKAASYRGPRKNLKEAKALFAQIEDFKKQIEAGNTRVQALQNSIAQYEKTKVTKQKALSEAERATSSDPEVYAEVTKLIDDRMAKLEKTISNKQEVTNKKEEDIAKLSKDIKAKKLAWAEGTATPETLKNMRDRLAKMRSSQKERRKQLAEFVKERDVLQARKSNRLGITRTNVLTGRKVSGERTKKASGTLDEEFTAEEERANLYATRSKRLADLQKQMDALQASAEPKTTKAKENRADKITGLQRLINDQIDAVNEVRPPSVAKVSQAARIQSQAPGKLRGGTEQSKATVGISRQPIVESRTPAQITSEKAVADANAFAERIAAAKDKATLDAEFKAKEYEQQNQILDAMEDNRVRLIKFITRSEDELAEIGNVPSNNPTLADRKDKLKADVESAQFMLDRVGDDINRLTKEISDPYMGEDKTMFTQLIGTDLSDVTESDIDTGYDDRYEFSRGTPVQGMTTTELRNELRRAVGDEDTYANKVSVYKSVDEFLQAKPEYKGQIPSDAKAFVDPDTERAYMFADNIAKNEGLAILLHEVGVHIGFRNFFNAGQYKALANAVRSWSKAPANTLEGKIGRAAEKRVREAGTSAAQMDDELIAYAVEEAVKAGVEPAGVKGGSAVANWLRMIVNAFNKALEKFGLAPESIKVGDLVNMAYGAAQLELKGTWHGTARAFKEFDHAYMGMGEGQQAFGWGTYRAQNERVAKTYAAKAVDAATQRAYDDPAFVKWLDESAPTIDGKSLKNLESKGHRLYADRTNPNLVPAAPNAQGKVLARPLISPVFKNKVAPKPLPLTYKIELVDFPDSVRATVLDALREVSDIKLYNGVAFDVVDAVKAVLKSSTSKENKAALTWVENNADRIGGGAQKKAPLVLPPETGAMLRTLHEQREDAFFNLDNQIPEQSDQVRIALEKVFYSLTDQQKAKFNSHLAGEENPSGKDVYGAFKLAIGNQKTVSERMASFGIAGNKFLDHYSRGKPVTEDSRYNYVDFLDKDQGAAIVGVNLNPIGPAKELLFSRKAAAPANALEALALDITAQPKTFKEKWGSNVALQTEMNAVDMRAGLRETLRFGDDKLFTQAMYHVRKAEQKMAQMFTVMNSGPLVAYKDDKGFVGYRSSNQNSARDVFDAIADIPVDDPQLKTNIAQAYMVAQRAANKGLSKLDIGELGITEEKLKAALAAANANPALKNALENVRRKYNAYNKGLIEFLASTQRITKKEADRLLKDGDYVPYYRVKDGNATLHFGNNVTFKVGDIRRQPYLAELKGGETKLLPLNEAIQQNTLLLTDMALTNNAAKSVAYGMQALGKDKGPIDPATGKPTSRMVIKKGFGDDIAGTVRFYQEPDPKDPKDDGKRHIVIDTKGTAAEGIPAELVVQSLEGASLALPGFFKLAGAASDLLRAGVTRTPLYIARKLIREPMAASFTGGLNNNAFSAVFKAGAEFIRMSRGASDSQAKLIEKGLIQSNIFSGDMSDMKKMALQLASGKDQSAMDKVFAAADRYAMRADAATLALVLKNAEENGLSEVEADMMTMESMNFYKRGLSPTLQYAARLIPFFNAQIQGLNVLVKAARGNMPFEEQQQIKRKFFNNAVLLMATGTVYAMAMEDDETFRNARPRDKYSNFFLPIPGVDEPLKLPIPFEAGYFFSLAVAAVDGMRAETDGRAQYEALRDMFLGSIPGYSSKGTPQIFKPIAEVLLDKNFLTGGPVEPRRLQGYDVEERYLSTTTDLAKQMSKLLPILSPIQIEHIVRGYLGVLPLVAAAGANSLFEREGKGEKPAGRASDLPLVGTAFQKKYGGGDADVVYREAQDAMDAKRTLNKMISEGRREEAMAYRDKNIVDLAMAPAAGQYRQIVGRINTDIRRTQERDDLTAEEKRLRLDVLDKAKQDRADAFIRQSRRVEERLRGGDRT